MRPDLGTKNPFGTNIDNLPVTVKNNGKTLLVTIGGDDRLGLLGISTIRDFIAPIVNICEKKQKLAVHMRHVKNE